MASLRRPFSNLNREAWQNLAAAAMLFLYVAQIALDLAWGNLFVNLGVDASGLTFPSDHPRKWRRKKTF